MNTEFMDTLYQFEISQGLDREAKTLAKAARQAIASADALMQKGSGESSSAGTDLEQALWKYREALTKYDQARRQSISPVFRKIIDLKIRECSRKARNCRALQKHIDQRTEGQN